MEIGYYPINLEFDIFGFSRGAALARHFVNVIKEHGVDYNKEFYYNPAKIRVKTLNIFDTVASFGKPGNDINIGFNLHIKPSFIVDKVNHFLADDEFRENFPAHLISNNHKDYPRDNINNKFEELVFLGAHSDIGGGYPDKFEHNVSNNELSKYYLEQMYNKCKEVEVPLNDKFPENWEANEEVKTLIEYFNTKYQKYSNLKVAHKILREKQAYLSYSYLENRLRDIEEQSQRGGVGNIYTKDMRKELEEIKDKRYIFSNIRVEDLRDEIDELSTIFENEFELKEFINVSNYFQDKYVHRPYSNSIGMSPKIKKNRYHREYYTTEIQKDVVDKQDAKIFYSNADVLENETSNIG